MNAPWVAVLATTGLAAVGALAWFAAERAEAKARAILLDCECAICQIARTHRNTITNFHDQLDEWGVTR